MPFSLLAGLANTIGSSIVANRQNNFNRNFQAQQAQLARDWQEDYYNKYSSPSAMVQQFKDAGLNPAMMYGRGASVVGGVPSGASPSGGSQMMPSFSLSGEVGNIIQLKEMIKNNESTRNLQSAQANLFSSQNIGQQLQNEFNPLFYRQNLKQGELNLQNTLTGINLAISQINLNRDELLNNDVSRSYYSRLTDLVGAQKATELVKQGMLEMQQLLMSSQKTQIDLDNFQKRWRNEFIRRNDVDPEIANNVWNTATQFVGAVDKALDNSFIGRAVSWMKSDPLKQLYVRYFGKK